MKAFSLKAANLDKMCSLSLLNSSLHQKRSLVKTERATQHMAHRQIKPGAARRHVYEPLYALKISLNMHINLKRSLKHSFEMKELLNLLIANVKVIIFQMNMVANEYLLIKAGLSPKNPLGCRARSLKVTGSINE